jgi:hypothetical protein
MVPPVIAVATRALTYLTKEAAVTVDVVLAADVVTALPMVKKLVPSRLPSRTTLPAETPALVVTVATALERHTTPSRTVPAPVAETAERDLMGCTPLVCDSMDCPVESIRLMMWADY